jgi:hypothetical protein
MNKAKNTITLNNFYKLITKEEIKKDILKVRNIIRKLNLIIIK